MKVQLFNPITQTNAQWSSTMKQLMVLIAILVSALTPHRAKTRTVKERLYEAVTTGSDILEISDMLENSLGVNFNWIIGVLVVYSLSHVSLGRF